MCGPYQTRQRDVKKLQFKLVDIKRINLIDVKLLMHVKLYVSVTSELYCSSKNKIRDT